MIVISKIINKKSKLGRYKSFEKYEINLKICLKELFKKKILIIHKKEELKHIYGFIKIIFVLSTKKYKFYLFNIFFIIITKFPN